VAHTGNKRAQRRVSTFVPLSCKRIGKPIKALRTLLAYMNQLQFSLNEVVERIELVRRDLRRLHEELDLLNDTREELQTLLLKDTDPPLERH